MLKVSTAVFLFAVVCTRAQGEGNDAGFELLYNDSLEEIVEPLKLNGTVPSWLSGQFLRNGPGRFDMGKRNFTFAWDGFAKISSYKFKNGEVYFQTRYLGNKFYNKSVEINDIAPTLLFGVTEPPLKVGLPGLMSHMNANNVNVHRFGNGTDGKKPLFGAVTDIAAMSIFDENTLSGIPFSWKDKLITKIMSAAHPQYLIGDDSVTVNYAATPSLFGNTTIELYKVSQATGMKREVFGTISIDSLPLIHSFGITENYVIMTLWPVRWHMGCLMEFKPIQDCMSWDDKARSTIALVPLDGSNKVRYFFGEPTMAWHHLNAYEESEKVVFDVNACRNCASPTAMKNMDIRILRNKTARDSKLSDTADPTLRQYTLNLKDNTLVEKDYSRKASDGKWYNTSLLPRFNNNFRGKKYCYAYLETSANAGSTTDYASMALLKKNLCNDAPYAVWRKENHYPSEPQFIPRPGATAEDDGVIVDAVLDGNRRQTYLLVLDGKTFKEIASIYTPTVQPTGLHGQFYPSTPPQIALHTIKSP
jgi:carotenoid cleavage dioxygenase-like enzyme